MQGQLCRPIIGSMVHANPTRGDLENPDVLSEYERGYKTLIGFFDKYL